MKSKQATILLNQLAAAGFTGFEHTPRSRDFDEEIKRGEVTISIPARGKPSVYNEKDGGFILIASFEQIVGELRGAK